MALISSRGDKSVRICILNATKHDMMAVTSAGLERGLCPTPKNPLDGIFYFATSSSQDRDREDKCPCGRL